MLVCHVSQSVRRAAIAAEIAEVATASDTATQGHVVFATLVDDPANVLDRVDARIGEIMLEAASAASVVNAGLVYSVAIIEAVTAADAPNASVPGVYAATIAEAASAADTLDASIAAAAVKTFATSAARVGMRSAIVQPAASKTQIVSDIGAVS